ncbi:MAG: hypothetical protein E6J28_06440, partial [Chloroflexi bacterium]
RDEHLYQPKRVAREGRSVSMVFRDSQLSNVIGFDYQRMSSIDAARDLIGRLHRIRDVQGDRDYLAVIALDGENAWEFYPRDGHDFLNALYTELESSSDIVTTTVSDFLAEHPPQQQLHHLHTGSTTWRGTCLRRRATGSTRSRSSAPRTRSRRPSRGARSSSPRGATGSGGSAASTTRAWTRSGTTSSGCTCATSTS